MVKYLPISSDIRKLFLLYDFAPDPIWISLYIRKILIFFFYQCAVLSPFSLFPPLFFPFLFQIFPTRSYFPFPFPLTPFSPPFSQPSHIAGPPLFLDVNVGVWEYAEEGPGFNLVLTFKQFVTLGISDAGTVYLFTIRGIFFNYTQLQDNFFPIF
jgi:hypothetical protein